MLHVPGYALGAPLGDPERCRMFAAVAQSDGRPVVLRRSRVSGVAARDALRSAVARVAGVRSPHLAVPCAVVATPDGLVVVYEADVADVWSGTEPLPDPAAAVLTVVAAVADLHEAGVAHGALVPDAVWFRPDGRVLLACLPGPEEVDMSVDGKNLQRFVSRLAAGHPALIAAVDDAGAEPAPRDLLSRLAPFAAPMGAEAVSPAPAARAPAAPARVAPAPAAPAPVASAHAAPAPTRPAQEVESAFAPGPPDLLRAPRPNRTLAGAPRPAAPTRMRRQAVVGVAAGVVLAAAAGVVVVARGAAGHPPLVAVTSTPAASPPSPSPPAPSPPSTVATTSTTRPSGPPVTGNPRWIAVLTALDGERDGAFETADAARLDEVYVAGSGAAATDQAALIKLRAGRLRAAGLALTVRDVRVVRESARPVVLRVTDELPAYRIVDADGATVRTEPGRGPATWRITLVKQSSGWRIATVQTSVA
jgi:hypothetical protein